LVLVGALAIVAGASTAPTAHASGDPYPNTPDVNYSGYTDPFAAYQAGALTPTDDANLALKLQGLDTDTLLTDLGTVADSSQVDYASARAAYAAMDGGLAPDLLALATGAGEGGMIPLLAGGAVGVGAIALTGLVAYHYHWFGFGESTSHDVYATFDRAKIGGAAVTVPANAVEGFDYGPMPGFGWRAICSTGTANSGVSCQGQSDYNASACHGAGVCWLFSYYMQKGVCNSGTGTCFLGGSNDGFIYHNFGLDGAMPRYQDCATQLANCYGLVQGGNWNADPGRMGLIGEPYITDLLGQAADTTLHDLTDPSQVGVFVLGASLDTDLYAQGHLYYGPNPGASPAVCGAAAEAPAISYTCEGAYIPDYRLDELLPRTSTTTLPGGAVQRGGTTEFHAPDPTTTTVRAGVTAATTDDCGRAMINYLLAPHAFAYYGCDPTQNDPGAGPTVPLANPNPPDPTLVTVPDCAGMTYADCLATLRDAGLVGTVTRTLGDPGTDGDTLHAPDMIEVQNPAAGTQVATGVALRLSVWASESGADPAPAENACGSLDNPCVTVDNTPDPTTGTGDAPVVPAIVWPVVPDLSGKWPFGMIGWVHDQLGGITNGSSCPSWNWTLKSSAVLNGDHNLVISLCFLDPYMPALRGLLLILSTLTLMWGMAAAVLGLSNLVSSNDTIIDLGGGDESS
jgi:hypothetical protein